MSYQILTISQYNNLTYIDPTKVYLIIDNNNQIIDVKRQNNVSYFYVRDSYPDNYLKPVLNKIVTAENLNINDVEVMKNKRNINNYYYVPFELTNISNNNYLINRFVIDHPSNVTINVYSYINQEMNSNYVLSTERIINLGNVNSPYTNCFTVQLLNERFINSKYKYDIQVRVLNLALLNGETNFDIEVEFQYNNQIHDSINLHLTFNYYEYIGD